MIGAKLKREVRELRKRKKEMLVKLARIRDENDIQVRNPKGFCFSRGK